MKIAVATVAIGARYGEAVRLGIESKVDYCDRNGCTTRSGLYEHERGGGAGCHLPSIPQSKLLILPVLFRSKHP
jgi:hypothetical protein